MSRVSARAAEGDLIGFVDVALSRGNSMSWFKKSDWIGALSRRTGSPANVLFAALVFDSARCESG